MIIYYYNRTQVTFLIKIIDTESLKEYSIDVFNRSTVFTNLGYISDNLLGKYKARTDRDKAEINELSIRYKSVILDILFST